MQVQTTSADGLIIIDPMVFKDNRGCFYESYNKIQFSNLGIYEEFVQDNESESQQNVLRGLHFQIPPHSQTKLVRVITGAVKDIVLDVRKTSPTFGQHYSFELSEENKLMLLIPEGFAHGFVTLRDNTIFSYKCSRPYNPTSERIIKWDDEDININWGIKNPIVSGKDKNGVSFKSFISPF